MGPWDAVGHFLADLIGQKRLEKWYNLLFTMCFSAAVTFLSATGTALVSHQPITIALGMGMLASAGALVFLYARSPLTKDIMVAVPKEAIVQGESEGLATIQPKRRDNGQVSN